MGIPGLTIAIFMYSVPRSTDITARPSTVETIERSKINKQLEIVFRRIIAIDRSRTRRYTENSNESIYV